MISVSKWENIYSDNYSWTWIGKIAIISEEEYCPEQYDYEDRKCKSFGMANDNYISAWLIKSNLNAYGWLLNDDPYKSAKVFSSTGVYTDERSNYKYFTYNYVFPTLYLKSNVQIISGTGLSTNPYILSLD